MNTRSSSRHDAPETGQSSVIYLKRSNVPEGDESPNDYLNIIAYNKNNDHFLIEWTKKPNGTRWPNSWQSRKLLDPQDLARFEQEWANRRGEREREEKHRKRQKAHLRTEAQARKQFTKPLVVDEDGKETWAVAKVLRYNSSKRKYLVRWEGGDENGVPHEDTWAPWRDLDPVARRYWRQELRRRERNPHSCISGLPSRVISVSDEDMGGDSSRLECQVATASGKRAYVLNVENIPYKALQAYDMPEKKKAGRK